MQLLLLLAIFVIATCGLIYELVAGTLASYLLGDTVTQFSTIIGVYLFAMGAGSYLSRYFHHNLLRWFIQIELLVGFIGGFSAAALFVLFPAVSSFRTILYAFVFATGTLVGLEIPLLMRILKDKVEFRDLVSKVFTFDYSGALIASLLFPLLLVPHLGLIRTALFFGILNIAVGLLLAYKFEKELRGGALLKTAGIVLLLAELAGWVFSDRIMRYSESMIYPDPVVYSTSTPYQRIAVTNKRNDLRLYLNGNLQFSSRDEYRYHEALIHPGLQAQANPAQVLVLGGGDGMAVREILKYPQVQQITLVDLDPAMTSLFSSNPLLTRLNGKALHHPKVTVINNDAFVWMRENRRQFDFIVIDFPDPSNFSIGKLYSNLFYRLVAGALRPGGRMVVQSTSPFAAPRSFWCINHTIQSAGFYTWPYHNMVPSFGEWGYILAGRDAGYTVPDSFAVATRFVNGPTARQMFVFPPDMQVTDSLPVNRLNNQALVDIFEKEWTTYLQ